MLKTRNRRAVTSSGSPVPSCPVPTPPTAVIMTRADALALASGAPEEEKDGNEGDAESDSETETEDEDAMVLRALAATAGTQTDTQETHPMNALDDLAALGARPTLARIKAVIDSWDVSDNVQFMAEAVATDGMALQYGSPRVRDIVSVVRTAVEADGDALQYASERLRADPSVARAAVSETSTALQWVSHDTPGYRTALLMALLANPDDMVTVLEGAPIALQADRDVVMTVIRDRWDAAETAEDVWDVVEHVWVPHHPELIAWLRQTQPEMMAAYDEYEQL